MVIKSVMLVALGFLSALMLALIFAPALWRRAVRLTTHRIRANMPMSLNEIQADKDRLRAEFAIKIRKYEVSLDREKMKTARQLVNISRRESEIKALEGKIDRLERDLEEQKNANRVYAQTISRRLPRMETQLDKAKELLGARYNEIAKLRTTINKQENKLGEAATMSQMRKAEVERLRVALESNSSDVSGGDSESPIARLERSEARNRELEAEVIKLRARSNSDIKDNLIQPTRSASFADAEVGQVVQRLLGSFSGSSAKKDADEETTDENAKTDESDNVKELVTAEAPTEDKSAEKESSEEPAQQVNGRDEPDFGRMGMSAPETAKETAPESDADSNKDMVNGEAENGASGETKSAANEDADDKADDVSEDAEDIPLVVNDDTVSSAKSARSLHDRLKEL